MPIDFVKMHRQKNIHSRLITLYKNTLNFKEDICLDLPFHTGVVSKIWRDSKIDDSKSSNELKFYKPKNVFENIYFKFRDFRNKSIIENTINEYKLYDFDIYHFDGGMDLFRELRFVRKLKTTNKKIVSCYFGSDLRTRGIFKEFDEMSDLNLTVEFDHLNIHPKINYIYFPFDTKKFKIQQRHNSKIKIIHSPTNRKFKGTDKIIKIIDEIKKERDFDFILLEKIDREEVLKIKSNCDIAIDQVGGELGGSGYGKNSVENLSMGIPTITEFSKDYLDFIKENPFIHSTIDTLKDKLITLIDNRELIKEYSEKGRKWVEKYHSFESVNRRLNELYTRYNILNNA
jgi:glycosyltransferase involved in cell wall biosynthesis